MDNSYGLFLGDDRPFGHGNVVISFGAAFGSWADRQFSISVRALIFTSRSEFTNGRIESVFMRVADWVVRVVVVATFFALLLAPEKWGFPFGLVSLGIVGAWALLYPQGVLGWVKTAHPSIDVEDPSLWWVPRLIGGFFMALAVLIAVFGFRR